MTVSAVRAAVATSDAAPDDLTVEGAEEGARRAAEASGVSIREIDTVTDCARASELLGAVWHMPPGRSPAEPNLLRVLGHRGGYVSGAYTDTGELLGAAVALFSGDSPRELHSHLTGVRADAQGRGVGVALKLHQQAWARRRSVETITWTFDPLIRRNASFNLGRLGAQATEYLTNFYGVMSDGINAGVESDRLFLRWACLVRAPARELPSGSQVLRVGDGGGPELIDDDAADLVQLDVPRDVERLRRSDPMTAAAWRLALRQVMAPRLASGWTILGFHPSGGYVMSA